MGRNSQLCVSPAPHHERKDRGDTMRSCLQNKQTWRRRVGEPPDEVYLNPQRVKLQLLGALGPHLAVKVFK